MKFDCSMINRHKTDKCPSKKALLENSFGIILALSQAEKRELINLWKAKKAHEQAAV